MKNFYINRNFARVMASCLLMAFGSNSIAQEKFESSSEFSISAAEKRKAAKRSGSTETNQLGKISDRHLDGVKGSDFAISIAPPPYTGRIADPTLSALRFYACNAAAFGEYRLVKERSFADENGNQIFTKRRFKLIDDWSKRNEKPQPQIDVVMVGGETMWQGEKIRLQNALQKYRLGRSYILAVGERDSSDKNTIFGESIFLEVDNGALYPGEGWNLFEPGTPVPSAKMKVEEALSMAGCAR